MRLACLKIGKRKYLFLSITRHINLSEYLIGQAIGVLGLLSSSMWWRRTRMRREHLKTVKFHTATKLKKADFLPENS